VYNILLKVRVGEVRPEFDLESQGFVSKFLGDVHPLNEVHYLGDGRLRIRKDVEQTLNESFGYIYGYDENNCLVVYRDRLGTFPLFMFENVNDRELVLFNRFYLVEDYWSDFSVDQTGFWETLLYESTLGARSLFSNVLQIPCASQVKIKPNLQFETKRYWHIDYEIDYALEEEEFFRESYERFDCVYSRLDCNKKYLLPISGGEDSRLMAAFISKYVPRKQVRAVTYGYDSRLLEYSYAKQVMSALHFNPPIFHTLTHGSYIRNLKKFAELTGGCIAIQNSHLFDYISNEDGFANSDILCCSAYSDGILGFDSTASDKRSDTFDDCAYYNILQKWKDTFQIPSDTAAAVESDLQELYSEWKNNSSITSIDEYIYLVERNSKFHAYSADMAREFGEIILPFTEPELVDFYLSIPNKYRFRKLGTIDMCRESFPAIANIPSIGSLFGKEGFKRPLQFTHFKLINFFNYIAAVYLGDKVILRNPYHTENQGYNLRKYHGGLLETAVNSLCANDVIDESVAGRLRVIPPRGASNYTCRYQAINAASVLSLFRNKPVSTTIPASNHQGLIA
jgi:hypothetical protein